MLRTHFISAVLALGISTHATLGCDVPVFRYALDHWPADTFQLEASADVLRAEPLATEFRNLSDGSGLNLQAVVSSNGARLFFPSRVRGATQPAWSGELTSEVYQSLTDSPARRELAKKILNGDSAVWVIVESGKKEADDAMVKLFTTRLRFLESATGLPPIDPTDPDSKLGPGPELRVKLSLLRVKRNDAKENIFLSMLAGPQGLNGFAADEPFVAVVFGRGRVLGAWPNEKVSEDFIEEATRFLLGSCSCEVKNQNPGWDLLMRLDWESELKKADKQRQADNVESGKPEVERAALTPETVTFTPKAAVESRESKVESRTAASSTLDSRPSTNRRWLFLGAGALALVALFLKKIW